MPSIEVTILRIVDDAFPGFVECKFLDAHDREHTVVEKAPIVSTADISERSSFPLVGLIACEVQAERTDVDGRVLMVVDTSRPYGIESVSGQTIFELLPSQMSR